MADRIKIISCFSFIFLFFYLTVLADEKGEIEGMIFSFRDITGRRKVEKKQNKHR